MCWERPQNGTPVQSKSECSLLFGEGDGVARKVQDLRQGLLLASSVLRCCRGVCKELFLQLVAVVSVLTQTAVAKFIYYLYGEFFLVSCVRVRLSTLFRFVPELWPSLISQTSFSSPGSGSAALMHGLTHHSILVHYRNSSFSSVLVSVRMKWVMFHTVHKCIQQWSVGRGFNHSSSTIYDEQ